MTDYRHTLLLPTNCLPMQANLPKLEPDLIDHWNKTQLFSQIRQQTSGSNKFFLHDGPPFANGHIHMGTALNKVVKDIINRMQQMTGKDAWFIPGWDTHGLPIEWLVVKEMTNKNVPIDANEKVNYILNIRQKCEKLANKWVSVQKKEFERLGVCADWEKAYLTMSPEYEYVVAKELLHLASKGLLQQKDKIVTWSVVENTSLAEAELEYKNIESTAAYISFPLVNNPHIAILIWTTTPWTIPCNLALAYNPQIKYGVYKITSEHKQYYSEYLILADDSINQVEANTGVKLQKTHKQVNLYAIQCHHPFEKHSQLQQYYKEPRFLFPADFVQSQAGTGIVHIAPAHGEEDFQLAIANNIATDTKINSKGEYDSTLPILGGKHIFQITPTLLQCLENLNTGSAVLGTHIVSHSCACSWRSKAPTIFMKSKQWFIDLKHAKQFANEWKNNTQLEYQDSTNSLKTYKNFLKTTQKNKQQLCDIIKNRKEWLISRQRFWGTPIPLFIDHEGKILQDEELNEIILKMFRLHGSNIWYKNDCNTWFNILAEKNPHKQYNHKLYKQVLDIVDVWFESGNSIKVIGEILNSKQADLYIEGDDQYRGWFQASMLAAATHKYHPFKNFIAHGFIKDQYGTKMSKSLGNVISPSNIANRYGADIIRIWVADSDFSKTITISETILDQKSEQYRKVRNTMRFILGFISNIDPNTTLQNSQITELQDLEKFILLTLSQINEEILQAIHYFDINFIWHTLYEFCDKILSSLFFDTRKDVLYCNPINDKIRIQTIDTMKIVFDYLIRLFAPFIPFTTEEIWLKYYKNSSIHLQKFISTSTFSNLNVHKQLAKDNLIMQKDDYCDDKYNTTIQKLLNDSWLLKLRARCVEKINNYKKSGIIKKNQEASITVNTQVNFIKNVDTNTVHKYALLLKELCSVSEVIMLIDTKQPENIHVQKTTLQQCARCFLSMSMSNTQDFLCERCKKTINNK